MSKPVLWATLVAGTIATVSLATSFRPGYTVAVEQCPEVVPGRQDL